MRATAASPTASVHAPAALEWHHLSGSAVLARMRVTAGGLTAQEASIRLADDGPNVLTTTGRLPAWRILLAQFGSVLVWLLIAAAAVSGFIGDPIDATAIIAIVILNAAVGFYQELSAEKSIFALQALTADPALQARLTRDLGEGSPMSGSSAETA